MVTTLQNLLPALENLATPWPFFLMVLGVSLGIVVGAIPGLTGAMLIALTLPLTFSMQNPADAMVLLVSMYVGSISGGLISATLLRMPGTPASMMTTLGWISHGRWWPAGTGVGVRRVPRHLWEASSHASFSYCWPNQLQIGRRVWARFDFFSLTLMALMLIATVAGESLSRGVFSGLLGVMATLPGVNPATGELRLTMGLAPLNDGLKLLPVLIGLFAVSQLIQETQRINVKSERVTFTRRGMLMGWRDWLKQSVNLI